jgi:plastocyanin domain-containing protein
MRPATQRKSLAFLAAAFALTSLGCREKAASLLPGEVEVKVDEGGFKPAQVTFKKGSPATLVFLRTTDDTCATEVVFPELNVKKDLPKGRAVKVEVPTDKEQKLTFQCGMGMYKSAVVIN